MQGAISSSLPFGASLLSAKPCRSHSHSGYQTESWGSHKGKLTKQESEESEDMNVATLQDPPRLKFSAAFGEIKPTFKALTPKISRNINTEYISRNIRNSEYSEIESYRLPWTSQFAPGRHQDFHRLHLSSQQRSFQLWWLGTCYSKFATLTEIKYMMAHGCTNLHSEGQWIL